MSRAGRKAFRKCDVKAVLFKSYVYTDDGEEKEVISTTPSEDSRQFAGVAAVLECPRTQDDKLQQIESQFTDHPTNLAALQSLAELAGELVCAECRYSNMTPVQVSIQRADFAKAEADRVLAYQVLEAARAEIRALESGPSLG